jgi:hypothetical protein
MLLKSWKFLSLCALLIVAICLFLTMNTAAESVTPETESTEAVTKPSEAPVPPETTPPPQEPVTPSKPIEEPTEPPATEPEPEPEPDIITDIEVRLYNDHKEGFNPVDGAAYCKDIAALLLKHAPKGLRISIGCAMAYTEGGAGKNGVYTRANNCFGIRATKGWSGWVFARSTQTVYKDYATAVKYGSSDFFRAYPTMEDSVKDYIRHMQNSRYGKVLTITNDYDYAHYIINQGYGPEHLADDWVWLVKYYDLSKYNIDWSLS